MALLSRRNLTIAAIAALAAAFLLGFIPQYQKARRLQADLTAAREQATACQAEQRLAQLRSLAGLAYLEVNRKNYGRAREHAARFFEQARAAAGSAPPDVQRTLEQSVAKQDTVIARLAQGDEAVRPDIEQIYAQLLTAAQ